jgi:hypothetical protein
MREELTVTLSEGVAELMGDGSAVVLQRDDRGCGQSVVLNRADLEALLARLG